MSTAAQRLHPHARGYLGSLLDGVDNPNNLTAAIVVDTLADKVALLERFDPFAAPQDGRPWAVHEVHEFPDLGPAWVLRWDRLALFIPERGDLRLPMFIVTQRAIARKRLRLDVINVVDQFGLRNRRVFLKPAPVRR